MPNPSSLAQALVLLLLFATTLPAQTASSAEPERSPEKSATSATPSENGKSDVEEHWQTILIGQERIGYVRSRVEPIGGNGNIRTDTETEMTFKRFGQELTIGVSIATTETADGELLGYQYEMNAAPAGGTKSVGTVKGKTLEIKTTIAGETATRTIPFDPTVKSPAYQDRLLREQGIEPGETREFRAFLPELNQVTDVTIQADDWEDVELPNGKTRSLLKTTITQSILPTLPVTAYLDKAGDIVLGETAMLGQTMRFFEVPKEKALAEVVGAELDLAVNSLIPATLIENPHETKRIVYRIHVPGEDAGSLFVDGGTQQVKRVDRETIEVAVTARPIPPSIPQGAATGQAEAEFTEASQMVQSDDETVREHLARAIGDERDPAKAARRLEAYVHEIISKKNFSNAFASAGEVADSLEGDCSEHAVLLAALLRAKGIPSRLVAGIVYVPNQGKMGGHMWTEALLGGEWIPLDATLGRGGIGAGHLKIGVTSLSDKAPLPVVCFAPLLSLGPEATIEVLEVER